jgi:hypothetical protein
MPAALSSSDRARFDAVRREQPRHDFGEAIVAQIEGRGVDRDAQPVACAIGSRVREG